MAQDDDGPRPQLPDNVAKMVLQPMEFGLAAYEREALRLGVPTHRIVEMLLNHLASIVAAIDPPGVRGETTGAITSQFASLVTQHVDSRLTTPGGIRLPDGFRKAG